MLLIRVNFKPPNKLNKAIIRCMNLYMYISSLGRIHPSILRHAFQWDSAGSPSGPFRRHPRGAATLPSFPRAATAAAAAGSAAAGRGARWAEAERQDETTGALWESGTRGSKETWQWTRTRRARRTKNKGCESLLHFLFLANYLTCSILITEAGKYVMKTHADSMYLLKAPFWDSLDKSLMKKQHLNRK